MKKRRYWAGLIVLIEIGRFYGMEMNVENSVMRILREPSSVQIAIFRNN
jgi:hypothetical protein